MRIVERRAEFAKSNLILLRVNEMNEATLSSSIRENQDFPHWIWLAFYA
jgi:hypothetical protein